MTKEFKIKDYQQIITGSKYNRSDLANQELIKYNKFEEYTEENIKLLFNNAYNWKEIMSSHPSKFRYMFKLYYFRTLVSLGSGKFNPGTIIDKYPFLKIEITAVYYTTEI